MLAAVLLLNPVKTVEVSALDACDAVMSDGRLLRLLPLDTAVAAPLTAVALLLLAAVVSALDCDSDDCCCWCGTMAILLLLSAAGTTAGVLAAAAVGAVVVVSVFDLLLLFSGESSSNRTVESTDPDVPCCYTRDKVQCHTCTMHSKLQLSVY
jgi:hypothetical protein